MTRTSSNICLKCFSLYQNKEIDMEMIQKIGREPKKTDTVYYTGHCTGIRPYEVLKEIMGSQIIYVHSGDTIKL